MEIKLQQKVLLAAAPIADPTLGVKNATAAAEQHITRLVCFLSPLFFLYQFPFLITHS